MLEALDKLGKPTSGGKNGNKGIEGTGDYIIFQESFFLPCAGSISVIGQTESEPIFFSHNPSIPQIS